VIKEKFVWTAPQNLDKFNVRVKIKNKEQEDRAVHGGFILDLDIMRLWKFGRKKTKGKRGLTFMMCKSGGRYIYSLTLKVSKKWRASYGGAPCLPTSCKYSHTLSGVADITSPLSYSYSLPLF